ncbi:MAG: 6-carboxytetrahydropterin synthase QueD [Deltaproteobacteria bacterium]|nr:6-carboxytetrahydropterin synthase QueD [Sandaracinaceae bacterium]MCX7808503.1 6-carboxytetrahydropterin synthase QueD [Deltaproteobacteria bacterium]MDW8244971.1 6-carboxytetrahydropterin synthase QueD [Sandaracinaceae bacterium]
MAQFEIWREIRFEAAHRLPRVPPGHRCHRLHGHSYTVRVYVRGEIDPELGWFMDLEALKALLEPIRERLDHRLLNEIEGLENPTSENLARWVWNHLEPLLPPNTKLSRVEVMETPSSGCRYEGD